MDHYVGIDVSLECSSVCVVEAGGKLVREGKIASEPEALIAWLGSLGLGLARIGLWIEPAPIVKDGTTYVMGDSNPAILELQKLLARYGYGVEP